MKKIFNCILIFLSLFFYNSVPFVQSQDATVNISSFSYSSSYTNTCNLNIQVSFNYDPSLLAPNKTYKVSIAIANQNNTAQSGTSSAEQPISLSNDNDTFSGNFLFQNISNTNNLNYIFQIIEYNIVGSGENQYSQFYSLQGFPVSVQNPCSPSSASGGGNLLSSESLSIDIPNPISNISSVSSFIEAVMDLVMKIGVPLLVIMVVYSGALYLFAQGNPNKIKEAHTALTYTLIGGVILLASWGVMQMIYSALLSTTAFNYSMVLFA